MSRRRIVLLAVVLFLLDGREGFAQSALTDSTRTPDTLVVSSPKDSLRWEGASLKTNLIYAASASANLGAEFAIGRHFSATLLLGLKSWPRWLFWDNDPENPQKWKHILVAPGFRWWPRKVYEHWFAGADLVWSHFNVGQVNFPFGMYPDVRNQRLQGDVYALGLFGGYSWRLARHWRIEAEAGVGLGWFGAQKYECAHCGAPLGPAEGLAIIPKLGVNIAWDITAQERPKDKKKREAARKELLNEINQNNHNN